MLHQLMARRLDTAAMEITVRRPCSSMAVQWRPLKIVIIIIIGPGT